jgi:hypothetical protein
MADVAMESEGKAAFSQRANSRKENTKTSRKGTKMSCVGLTQGKIIFGYTPRVV